MQILFLQVQILLQPRSKWSKRQRLQRQGGRDNVALWGKRAFGVAGGSVTESALKRGPREMLLLPPFRRYERGGGVLLWRSGEEMPRGKSRSSSYGERSVASSSTHWALMEATPGASIVWEGPVSRPLLSSTLFALGSVDEKEGDHRETSPRAAIPDRKKAAAH